MPVLLQLLDAHVERHSFDRSKTRKSKWKSTSVRREKDEQVTSIDYLNRSPQCRRMGLEAWVRRSSSHQDLSLIYHSPGVTEFSGRCLLIRFKCATQASKLVATKFGG